MVPCHQAQYQSPGTKSLSPSSLTQPYVAGEPGIVRAGAGVVRAWTGVIAVLAHGDDGDSDDGAIEDQGTGTGLDGKSSWPGLMGEA